jgi:hypothetical protein
MDLPLPSCTAPDCMGVKEDPVLPAGGMNWETAWLRSSCATAWPVRLYASLEGTMVEGCTVMATDCLSESVQDPALVAGGMNWETAWLSSSCAPAWTVSLYALHEGGTAVPKDAAPVRKEGVACE